MVQSIFNPTDLHEIANTTDTTMAPLVLEGQTLGQKHRHFNGLVKASVADQSWNLEKINHTEPDAQNLLRIDVACGRREVPYILEVMKSNDLLYVTRAIKRSTWLITEEQYAHIINPTYLEQALFPSMTAKAKTKLLFAIKQNLKDENRVEAFFNFYKDDPQVAMKWLPGCSVATIEKFVHEHPDKFSVNQIKRLCKRSFAILKIYCKEWNAYHKKYVLEKATNYIKSNCNEYLDIIDSIENYYKPKFNKNTTQFLMENCRDRIIQKFEKYCHILHLPTFARNLKSEEVQEFLLKQRQNKELNYWFKFENIKHFAKYIPKNTRLQFIKSLFVEKDKKEDDNILLDCGGLARCAMSSAVSYKSSALIVSNEHVYRWYRYAPFNIALTELKKLIHAEPLPAERNAMFTILIKCAGSNQEQLKTLLEYYRNNHINEPFKFKIQFVNTFLSHTKTHEFDDTTWNILNNIFSSMEVFMESDNKVPFCIDAIIVYKVLHDQPIPEIIEKKFTFSTLKNYSNKLAENQQNKIFDYLYNHLLQKLQNQKITNESEISENLSRINGILNLLKDWKKNIKDYPIVISQIKHLIEIKRQNSWDIDLTGLYNSVRRWRKHLFEISLVMHPSDEACLNALKHDPGLLSRYQKEVEMMYSNDAISIERTLKKVRIYWSESISQQWTNYYLERIEQPKGQKAVKYICTLIPSQTMLPLIEENAPIETKINWNEASDLKLILRKNIGKFMHLIRPSVSLDTVLLYAKGDYLYHTLPSLNAILYNISSDSTSEYITKLLNAPVSLQKHGICAIFKKLKYKDIKDIVSNLWNNTKNSSIKTILFRQTFVLLCKEKNDSTVKDLWQLFEMYINSLTTEENANIYHIFTKFKDVHITVKPLFFMKGYSYLKSLPPKANCDKNIKTLFNEAASLIDLLEPSFVEDVLLMSLKDKYIIKNISLRNHFQILTSYILSCKSEETQIKRYEKLLLPILQEAFASWKLRHKGKYYIKIRSKRLLDALTSNITTLTATKQNIMPVKLFKAIQDVLTQSLLAEENYDILMNWKLATLFVETVDTYVKNNPQIYTEKDEPIKEKSQITMPYSYNNDNNKIWEKICLNVTAPFGEACKDYLKKDIFFNQYPVLYTCINDVLMELCSNLSFNDKNKFTFLKGMLAEKELTTIYCIVLEAIRHLHCSSEDKPLKKEILKIIRSNTSAEVNILICFYETSDYNWDSELEDDEKEQDNIKFVILK
ncbi:hypothetical protein evm_007857 [Chilo suppressalis]|nr:hypothetical protein evm_007857 [Chilo suppressalis]